MPAGGPIWEQCLRGVWWMIGWSYRDQYVSLFSFYQRRVLVCVASCHVLLPGEYCCQILQAFILLIDTHKLIEYGDITKNLLHTNWSYFIYNIVTDCIYIPGKPGICLHYYLCTLWWVQIVGYVLAGRSYSSCLYITPSHYHHCANLSEDIELICQIYFVECVSKIKHIPSVIHHTICEGLCVFSLPISPVMIERIYILCLIIIIIKSEVWTFTHCLGLGHETMVCVVCLSIFLS